MSLSATTEPRKHYPFAWASSDDSPIVVGAAFTLVRGVSPRQALRLLVPDRKTPLESPVQAEAWVESRIGEDDQHYPQLIEAGQRHGWTMVLEDNGFRATDLGMLRRLSRAGAAVVVYNNVNFDTSFQYAVKGRVLRDFDPLSYSAYGFGPALRQEHGIPFGHGQGAQFVSQSLQLASRLIGFSVVPADLQTSRYSVAVGAIS